MNKYIIAGGIAAIIWKLIVFVFFVVLLIEAVYYMTAKEWDAAAAYIAALMLLKLNEIEDKL